MTIGAAARLRLGTGLICAVALALAFGLGPASAESASSDRAVAAVKAKGGKKKCRKGKTTGKRASSLRRRGCKKRKKKKAPAASPQPPAPPASSPTCGGATVLMTENGTFRCSFEEEFAGTGTDPSTWDAERTQETGFTHGRIACFVDSPGNISVSGGTLKLIFRKEAEPFTCRDPLVGDYQTQYTSGMISTDDRFAQAYGRFEFKARVWSAEVKGLQSALWLWPDDAQRYGPHPASGEIDIAEMYSLYPDRAIPYIHYSHTGASPVTNNFCMISDLDGFHTYAAEWTPTRIKISFDGQTCLDHLINPASPLSGSQPFDQPFILVLTQAPGVSTNAFDPTITPLPAATEVDYVRVWSWLGG